MQKHKKGFTLIELLVVIAVIGLLASIVLVAVNSAREKTKAVKIVSDFKQIETAFYLWMDAENRTQWWHEDFWGAPTDSPNIDWLIVNTDLNNFLSVAPFFEGKSYFYDNDNDIFDADGDGCDAGIWAGVNLGIQNFNDSDLFSRIDEIIDGGDGSECGRYTGSGTAGVYKLSKSYTIY